MIILVKQAEACRVDDNTGPIKFISLLPSRKSRKRDCGAVRPTWADGFIEYIMVSGVSYLWDRKRDPTLSDAWT